MKKNLHPPRATFALVLVALAAGIACERTPVDIPPIQPPGEGEGEGEGEGDARIRVLHLSGDTGAVDVFANEAGPVIEDLAFGESSVYLDVEADSYTFDVAPSGAGVDESALTLEDVDLEAGSATTAFAYDDEDGLAGGAFEDSVAGLAEGDIRLRVIHAARSVSAVNVWNVTPRIDGSGEAAPLYQDVPLGAVGDAIDVPAGAYVIGVDVIEQGAPDSIELYFDLPELEAGRLVNVFAAEDAEGEVFLLAQLEENQTARFDPAPAPELRVMHVAGGVGNVDVFVNDAAPAAISDLPFAASTGFVRLDPGSYDFDVAPAGAGLAGSALSLNDVALRPGSRQTVFAYQGREGAVLGGSFSDSRADLADGDARVRVIHAARDLSTVDVLDVSEADRTATLFSDLSFGEVSPTLDIPAGSYLVGIDLNGDQQANVLVELPELAAGTLANLFATQDAEGDVVIIAQLWSDDIAADTTATIAPATSEIRVVHLADAPPVDLFVDRVPTAAREGLPFLGATGYIERLAGWRTFQVAPAGASLDDAVLTITPELAPDARYTAIAYGRIVDGEISGALFEDSAEDLDEGLIRVRAVHAAPDLPRVSIYNAADTSAPLYEDVPFGAVGQALDVPADAYTLLFDFDGELGNEDDVSFSLPAVSAGSLVTLVAAQAWDEAGEPPFLAVLVDDATPLRLDPS